MVDLWIQFLRHEIQYVDEIMYFLVNVMLRAISELCSTVSLLCHNQVIYMDFLLLFFLHNKYTEEAPSAK